MNVCNQDRDLAAWVCRDQVQEHPGMSAQTRQPRCEEYDLLLVHRRDAGESVQPAEFETETIEVGRGKYGGPRALSRDHCDDELPDLIQRLGQIARSGHAQRAFAEATDAAKRNIERSH